MAVEECRASASPPEFGLAQVLAGNPLDDGDELHVLCFEFISEIAIDLKAVVFVSSVDRAQDVGVDFGVAKLLPPADHHRVSSVPATVETVGVM